MKLLHPFMPFITETIWQSLPHEGQTIMLSPWPRAEQTQAYPQQEEQTELLMDIIRAVRNRRAELSVAPSKKAQLLVVTEDDTVRQSLEQGAGFVQKLAYASQLQITDRAPEDAARMVNLVVRGVSLYLPLSELIDFEAERKRLTKEREKAQKELAAVENKLNNPGFVSKAPEKVVDGERQKAERIRTHLQKLEESLKALQ